MRRLDFNIFSRISPSASVFFHLEHVTTCNYVKKSELHASPSIKEYFLNSLNHIHLNNQGKPIIYTFIYIHF